MCVRAGELFGLGAVLQDSPLHTVHLMHSVDQPSPHVAQQHLLIHTTTSRSTFLLSFYKFPLMLQILHSVEWDFFTVT